MKSILKTVQGVVVVVVSVFAAATIFAIPVKAAEPSTYIQSGTIWSESAGEYQVLDDAGELWGFTAGVSDYVVGQYVEMTMSDAGTPENIYDDTIVAVSPVWRGYESDIVGPFGYYVVDGWIATDNTRCLSCWVRDSYGSLWLWNESCPKQQGEHVVLIMNSNGTPDRFSDDFIEDVLWSESAAEED